MGVKNESKDIDGTRNWAAYTPRIGIDLQGDPDHALATAHGALKRG